MVCFFIKNNNTNEILKKYIYLTIKNGLNIAYIGLNPIESFTLKNQLALEASSIAPDLT